jgi:hypothetical protein
LSRSDPGDIPRNLQRSYLTVGDILDDLYDLRNYLAHGDKIPDCYFERKIRTGIGLQLDVPSVCMEAQSIIRGTMLRILSDGLLDDFANASRAEKFFKEKALSNSSKNKLKLPHLS